VTETPPPLRSNAFLIRRTVFPGVFLPEGGLVCQEFSLDLVKRLDRNEQPHFDLSSPFHVHALLSAGNLLAARSQARVDGFAAAS